MPNMIFPALLEANCWSEFLPISTLSTVPVQINAQLTYPIMLEAHCCLEFLSISKLSTVPVHINAQAVISSSVIGLTIVWSFYLYQHNLPYKCT